MISFLLSQGIDLLFVFCRVGACLMLFPAFSSIRVPVRFRLYIALGIAAGIQGLVGLEARPSSLDATFISIAVIREVAIGLIFGFMVRVFFVAVEFIGEYISMMIGLSSFVASGVGDGEQMPVIASFLSLVFTALFLITDLHHYVLLALVDTYRIIPIGKEFPLGGAFAEILQTVSLAFVTALRIAAPFILVSILINFGFGIINRAIPQVPAYFLSVPLSIIVGLIVLMTGISSSSYVFFGEFEGWVRNF